MDVILKDFLNKTTYFNKKEQALSANSVLCRTTKAQVVDAIITNEIVSRFELGCNMKFVSGKG